MPANPVLCVDLDGTLIRTDLLHEQIATFIQRRPQKILSLLWWIVQGKAYYKEQLAKAVGDHIDVSLLPYDEGVIAEIKRRKKDGAIVELVSGTHHSLVARVAAYLGIFDNYLGSTTSTNLTGNTKASTLSSRHPLGYSYIGNGRADFPVWHASEERLLAQATARSSRMAADLGRLTVLTKRQGGGVREYLRTMRIHQWVKNGLVFIPLALTLSNQTTVLDFWLCGLGFVAFCLLSSGTYFINDILDVQADRAHPIKRARAIARGAINMRVGITVAALLTAAGFCAGFVISLAFVVFLAVYFILSLFYSIIIKKIIVLDVMVLSFLFLLRAYSGGVIIDRTLTLWLASFLLFFFLSLSISKRVIELKTLSVVSKTANGFGRGYLPKDLNTMTQAGISLGIASILLFIIYTIIETTSIYHHDMAIIITIALLGFWMLRLWILISRGDVDDDPVVFAIRDSVTIVTFLAVIAIALFEQVLTTAS